jgi:hypothetical protein
MHIASALFLHFCWQMVSLYVGVNTQGESGANKRPLRKRWRW